MKKKGIIAILVISVLILIGINWKPILLWTFGFRMPKLETEHTVKQYVSDANGKYDILCTASDKTSYEYLFNNLHAPGVIFFDKNLSPIHSSSGAGCPKVAHSFISGLTPGSRFSADTTGLTIKSLLDILDNIHVIKGDKNQLAQIRDSNIYDYIIVYSWNKILAKQSKTMMTLGEEAIKQENMRIFTISLNLDFVNTWATQKDIDEVEIE